MTTHLFIDGAAGTTGLEIRERIAGRDEFALILLDEADRKKAAARRDALNAADIVILCLPDDAAGEAVALIDNPNVRVIDASSAHRVAPGWTYGFPELAGADAIAKADRVSNPGCYPTGFLALVKPLLDAGLVPGDWPFSINATSGYSGGGKAMIAEFEGGTAPAFRAYATNLAHKHVAEMQYHAGLAHPPLFAPAVANTYRGMVVEVPLALAAMPGSPPLADCADALRAHYAGHSLINVVECDALPVAIEENAGSDRMTLRVCGNAGRGQARLIATLDNLGKGAAGAAVQNLNLMAGLDPLAGLIV